MIRRHLKILFKTALLTFLLFAAKDALAATLYLNPANGTFTVDRNFTVSVFVSSGDQAMNAAEGVINFPTDKLQVVGLSKSGSIFNLWVQEPSFSNSGSVGNVRFEGVVLNPGFQGIGAKILDITFRARTAGVATVNFNSGSVLANDGSGTNILVQPFGSGTYTLQVTSQPPITSTGVLVKPSIKHFIKNRDGDLILFNTSEEELKWTNSSFARLTWAPPQGVSGVVTAFNEESGTVLGSKSEGLFDSKTFNFLEEGRHYFHLKYLSDRGAGAALHYPLFVDLTSPEPITLELNEKVYSQATYSTSNPRPTFKFYTTDALSGIDHYEVKIDDGEWVSANTLRYDSRYQLPKQKPGTHLWVLRAYDKAGNFAERKIDLIVEPAPLPVITNYTKRLTSPGEKLVVEGTASPVATVDVYLRKFGNEPIILTTKAYSNGKWMLIYDETIESGGYKLTAKQILESGAESFETEPVYVSVNSLFWRALQWLLNVGGIIIIFILLVLLLLVGGYYLWHRFGMFKLKLRKEAKEAREALERGLKHVEEDIDRGESKTKLKEHIEKIEKQVEKEIKDIENKL